MKGVCGFMAVSERKGQHQITKRQSCVAVEAKSSPSSVQSTTSCDAFATQEQKVGALAPSFFRGWGGLVLSLPRFRIIQGTDAREAVKKYNRTVRVRVTLWMDSFWDTLLSCIFTWQTGSTNSAGLSVLHPTKAGMVQKGLSPGSTRKKKKRKGKVFGPSNRPLSKGPYHRGPHTFYSSLSCSGNLVFTCVYHSDLDHLSWGQVSKLWMQAEDKFGCATRLACLTPSQPHLQPLLMAVHGLDIAGLGIQI